MDDPHEIVIVIDDDPSVREGIGDLLQSAGFAAQIYANANDFLAAPLPDAVRCILSDIRMPGRSGLDLQEHLKRAGVSIPIVFMSAHGDIRMSVQALKSGAVDFLVKPLREQDLLDAVRRALDQDGWTRGNAAQLRELLDRVAILTMRERDVFKLVCAGLMNKEIAFRLGIKEITVKIHRAQMMHKLGAPNIVSLVRMHDRIIKAEAAGEGSAAMRLDDHRSPGPQRPTSAPTLPPRSSLGVQSFRLAS
jgi:FixJ family two-component response regulator